MSTEMYTFGALGAGDWSAGSRLADVTSRNKRVAIERLGDLIDTSAPETMLRSFARQT